MVVGQSAGFGQKYAPLTAKVKLFTAVNVAHTPASFIQVPARLTALGTGQPGTNLIVMPVGHVA